MSNPLNENDYLTIEQLAALKDVAKRTVHFWVNKGIGPTPVRFHDRTYFLRAEAEAFTPPGQGKRP